MASSRIIIRVNNITIGGLMCTRPNRHVASIDMNIRVNRNMIAYLRRISRIRCRSHMRSMSVSRIIAIISR